MGGGAIVAGEAGCAGACDGGDDVCAVVDLADDVVLHLDDVEVAFGVEAYFVGFIEGGLCCWAAVSGVTGSTGACDGGELVGCGVPALDAVVFDLADVEIAIGAERDAEWLADEGWVAVAYGGGDGGRGPIDE